MSKMYGAVDTRPMPPRPMRGYPQDLYITTCKLCPHGIYPQETHTWLRRPAGYSHNECIDVAIKQGITIEYLTT